MSHILQKQRELLALPRNLESFQTYLRTLSPDGATLEYPSLVMMNPMSKEHVAARLDELLALDADGIAMRALAEAAATVADAPGDCQLALVLVDDQHGGWTNRYDYEFNQRGARGRLTTKDKRPAWLKEAWLTGILWSSEAATERAVREAVLTVVYRAAYVQRHGAAATLGAMLAQERQVMQAAGCTLPALDPTELAHTRAVLTPLLGATDMRTCIECLFGDAAGETLGFTPRGLRHWAGLALALQETLP